MIPLYEIGAFVLVIIIAAAVTGASMYMAGLRYRRQLERANADERAGRRESTEVYRTMQATLHDAQVTIRELGERVNAVEDDAARARGRIRELETNLAHFQAALNQAIDGANALIAQLAEAGVTTPVWIPTVIEPIALPLDRVVLQDQLRRRFNVEELDDIAQRLGINPDDIVGQTRQKRARELVDMAERLDVLDDLLEVARELRPSAKW